jgi:hypothetical protein
LAGLLHGQGIAHPWLAPATDFCWQAIAASELSEPHEPLCIITFLERAPDRARAERAFQRVAARLGAGDLVALDPAASGYVKKPLDWVPTPASWCQPLFSDDAIAAHLAALVAAQQVDGGWPITWSPVSPAGELEWRGMVTLTALKTLRAYGWLDA